MNIFFRLDFTASLRKLISERKCDSLKILKIRKRRNARKTSRDCAPARNMLKYMGRIESKSTSPRKLKTYRKGFFIQINRSKYSIVNKIVNAHSSIKKVFSYACSDGMLSSITTAMLARIDMSKQMSNTLPAMVLDSKITSCILAFQFLLCKLIFAALIRRLIQHSCFSKRI